MSLLLTADSKSAETAEKLLTTLATYKPKEVNFTDGVVVEDMDIYKGVAVINVRGTIIPAYNYVYNSISFTALNILRAKIEYAVNSADVDEIVLHFDSPGGYAASVHETAKYIRDMTQLKKITAYVSGTCASAAYWLASACSEIAADSTAELGSIGVVMSLWKTGDYIVSIISRQSPNKNPDPATDAGREEYQRRADDMAEIFISSVGTNRGMSREEVIMRGHQGGMMIAQKAIDAGLADKISTLNELLNTTNTEDSNIMDIKELKEKHGGVYAEAVADGVQREMKRQADIRAVALPGYEDIINTALADPTKTAADVSTQIIMAQKNVGPEAKANLLKGSVAPVPGAEASPADAPGDTKETSKMDAACAAAFATLDGVK